MVVLSNAGPDGTRSRVGTRGADPQPNPTTTVVSATGKDTYTPVGSPALHVQLADDPQTVHDIFRTRDL